MLIPGLFLPGVTSPLLPPLLGSVTGVLPPEGVAKFGRSFLFIWIPLLVRMVLFGVKPGALLFELPTALDLRPLPP